MAHSTPLLPDNDQNKDIGSAVSGYADTRPRLSCQHVLTNRSQNSFGSLLVDTVAGVSAMLDILVVSSSAIRPTIFIDLEGVNLGREGELCLLAIHHTVSKRSFVVDVYCLGTSAFSAPASDGTTTLKTILESPTIAKGIFDVRNDSAALYHGFGVRLQSMHDIQLLEIVARPQLWGSSRRFRAGLDKVVRSHSNMTAAETAEWTVTKTLGVRLFAPEKGGSYDVFRQRPLNPLLIPYSVNDVVCLPQLFEKFTSALPKHTKRDVASKTEQGILESLSPQYRGRGRDRALSPWA
jgi:exonuclease 3'-5' domain-containing protein 1